MKKHLANDARFSEGNFQRPVGSETTLRANCMIANAAKHKGFEGVAKSISEKQNIPIERARAIAAGAARSAGKKAKKSNP
jgi:hypothetical protein